MIFYLLVTIPETPFTYGIHIPETFLLTGSLFQNYPKLGISNNVRVHEEKYRVQEKNSLI